MIALRPEPGLTATLAAGRDLGLEITGAALFSIEPAGWEPPDPASIDALLVGSANALRHGGSNLTQFLSKPVHVVGKATELAACEAGFAIASVGEGGLQTVVDRIAPPARLLRIAGAEHVELTAPDGVAITTVIAYRARPLPLDPDLLDGAGAAPLVLLHSAAAARHFAEECDRIGVPRDTIAIAALGARIAAAAGPGWRSVHVSDRLADSHLLALADRLCQ